MSAEHVPETAVAAFPQEMEIEIAQGRPGPVRVIEAEAGQAPDPGCR